MTSPARTPSNLFSPESPIAVAGVFAVDEVADSASDSSNDDEYVPQNSRRSSSALSSDYDIEEEYDSDNDEGEEELDEGASSSEFETNSNDQNLNLMEATDALNEGSAVLEELNEVMPNPESDSTSAGFVAEGFEEDNVIYVADDVEQRVSLTATQGDFQGVKVNKRGSDIVETQAGTDADVSSSCPICMEPWTSVGNHRISCLPCGHLFGWSCIRKWIQQGGKRVGKCPHCNKKCKGSEIRILYVPRIAVADGEMQQELTLLRAENKNLKLENKNLTDESHRRKEEQAHFMDIKQLRVQKQNLLDEIRRLCGQKALLAATVSEPYGSSSGCQRVLFDVTDEWRRHEPYEPLSKKRHALSDDAFHLEIQGILGSTSSPFGTNRGVQPRFNLQAQLVLEGGRYFDMDASSQMLLVSQKASDLGSVHFLTKISFLAFRGGDKIHLPNGTGPIRDFHIAPASTSEPGRLALVASMGKKLSLVNLQTKNVVLTYSLECPAWSCAWAFNDPHTVYSGLQNGKLLIFDLRITSSPTNDINGFNSKPIHTLHSVVSFRGQNNEYGRAVLGASCVGPTLWHVEDPLCRPISIPGLENQGACISLAHATKSDIAVASYRPFVASACGSPSMEGAFCSQSINSEGIIDPSSLSRAPRMGSHFVLTKNGRNSQFGGRMAHQEFSAPGDGSSLGIEWNFNSEKVMHGCVSAVGVPKSAIVTLETPGKGPDCKQSLFAYGDELKKAVSLWDVQRLSTIDCLEPHETPIQDVKHVQMQGKDILGCVSEKQLQIYAYS